MVSDRAGIKERLGLVFSEAKIREDLAQPMSDLPAGLIVMALWLAIIAAGYIFGADK